MLKKLILKYFQSHKDSTLEFTDGINIIQGDSDSGKTAILRALDWNINNGLNGDFFISFFIPRGEKTESVLEFADSIISRIRTKSDNIYKLDDNEFTGFGRNVPDPIKDLYNMNYINFQKQFDQPFMIADSNTEITKKLNEIAHLEDIDISSKNISVRQKRINAERKAIKNDIEDLDREIKKYRGIRRLDTMITQYEDLLQQKEKNENDSRKIKSIHKQIEACEAIIFPIPDTNIIDTTIDLIEAQYETMERYNKLVSTRDRIEEIDSGLIEIPNIFIIENTVKIFDECEENKNNIRKINNIKSRLLDLDDEIDTTLYDTNIIDECISKMGQYTVELEKEKNLKSVKNRLSELDKIIETCYSRIEELESSIPDVCPTCGQLICEENDGR